MRTIRIALLALLCCALHGTVVLGQACCSEGYIKFKLQNQGANKPEEDLKNSRDYKDWVRISDFSLTPNTSSSSGAVLKFTVTIGGTLPQFIGGLALSEVVTQTTVDFRKVD